MDNSDIKESIHKLITNTEQKNMLNENLVVFSKLDEIIQNGLELASSETDTKGRKQFSGYKYYVSKVAIDGKPHIVEFDTRLKKGQVLAYMNSSGFSTGDHLHFEVRKNGASVDPKPFLLGEKVFSKKSVTVKNKEKYHKVVSGDTLLTIAEKHYGDGMKYKDLAKINNIQAPYIIHPGQKIKLRNN